MEQYGGSNKHKIVGLSLLLLLLLNSLAVYGVDYLDALSKTILFYEAQRSGKLPSNQRANWRADSGLKDGLSQGIDLSGGYYDAGDNVKFGFPMAHAITMLSWGVVEYGKNMASVQQLNYALEAIKWGTDYLIKAHPQPNILWGEVGDGYSDHACWQRPEDMTTPRQAYRIDSTKPGSDLAGETAAAMAAASIAFRSSNPSYSSLLLNHAKQLFTFADTYRGTYHDSISIALSFYQSFSGYKDELLWAAIWLYHATSDQYYLNYVINNAGSLGGIGVDMTEFSWDNKYAGVQILAAKALLEKKSNSQVLEQYKSKANFFVCSCLQKNNGNNVQRTSGGLMFWRAWSNMQYVASAGFLMVVYADYLSKAGQRLQCPQESLAPSQIIDTARSQVDYILGNNPKGKSYVVGYGSNYPERVHHRAASIVSLKKDPTFVSCGQGYESWFYRNANNPNVLVGSLVGGPDQNDNFLDSRDNYAQNEPATTNNAPLVGLLARLTSSSITPTPTPTRPRTPPPPPRTPTPTPTPTRPPPPPPRTPSPTPTRPPPPPPRTPSPPPTRPPPPGAGGINSIVITQRRVASWVLKGRTYHKYEATVLNKSSRTLSHLVLSVTKLYGNIWGLSKLRTPNLYSFPSWISSLPPHKSLIFVYNQPALRASVYVRSVAFK